MQQSVLCPKLFMISGGWIHAVQSGLSPLQSSVQVSRARSAESTRDRHRRAAGGASDKRSSLTRCSRTDANPVDAARPAGFQPPTGWRSRRGAAP